MKNPLSILLAALFFAGFFQSADAQPPRQGPFFVVEYKNMKGESEFVMLSSAEKAERDKIVQLERHYYLMAQRMAAKEWYEGDSTLKYPGTAFRPPESRKVSFSAREKDALKTLRKTIERHEKQLEIRERNDEMERKNTDQRNRYSKRVDNDKDIYARQRAATEEGYSMLLDKMEELMARANAPGSRTVRPEQVGGFGQPR